MHPVDILWKFASQDFFDRETTGSEANDIDMLQLQRPCGSAGLVIGHENTQDNTKQEPERNRQQQPGKAICWIAALSDRLSLHHE